MESYQEKKKNDRLKKGMKKEKAGKFGEKKSKQELRGKEEYI